jgi:ABC-type transporter MlaC component
MMEVRMRICRIIVILIAAAIALFSAAMPAFGNDASPRSYVQRLASESLGIIDRSDAQKAGEVFATSVDMPMFARRCLADHWSTISETQRAEFIDLFSRSLRGRMNEALAGRVRGRTVSLRVGQPVRTDEPGITRIPLTAMIDGKTVRIVYFLTKNSDGWRMVDYEVEGALLSRNYRGQFNYLMRTYGYVGMMDRLRKKAESVGAKA